MQNNITTCTTHHNTQINNTTCRKTSQHADQHHNMQKNIITCRTTSQHAEQHHKIAPCRFCPHHHSGLMHVCIHTYTIALQDREHSYCRKCMCIEFEWSFTNRSTWRDMYAYRYDYLDYSRTTPCGHPWIQGTSLMRAAPTVPAT